MTNEIIYIQDYALIVSDEQAKENDWGYIPFEGGQVKLIGKFFADDWRKVIGYRPLNHSAWILEGVPLLPDFGLGDDVEGLAEKEYYEQSKSFEDSLVDPIFDTSRFSVVGFIDGYNKAKETLYTEEQVEDLIKKAITETANAYLEWIKDETDIVDVETRLVIPNSELNTRKDSKSLTSYIYNRLKEQGIKVNH